MTLEGDYTARRNVERQTLTSLDKMDHWLACRVTYRKFVEDIRLVVGEIGNDELVLRQVGDNPCRDKPCAGYVISPQNWRAPATLNHRLARLSAARTTGT